MWRVRYTGQTAEQYLKSHPYTTRPRSILTSEDTQKRDLADEEYESFLQDLRRDMITRGLSPAQAEAFTRYFA
ncbi:MAG: hypothetical protein KGZ53_04550 [Peptococcaceae bacterium]|nr:hypothetical protein [Peptococcaceae bacterium]